MEGVEGAIMTYATKCLLEEILEVSLPVQLRIDNSAAISLLTTAAGNWENKAPFGFVRTGCERRSTRVRS